MSPGRTRRRRAVAVIAAGWIALTLLGGIAWHVSDLRSTTVAAARRRLATGATATARMVDLWLAARDGDANELADFTSTRRADSLGLSPAESKRLLELEMQSVRSRGRNLAVWIVDPRGQIVASTPSVPPSVAEDSAIAAAIAARARTVSRPERRDRTLAVAVVTPVFARSEARSGTPAGSLQALVVIRSDLSGALSMAGAPRVTTLAPVIVMPTTAGALGLTLCPGPTAVLCIMPTVGRLARIAMTEQSAVLEISVNGKQTLVATARPTTAPWPVYVAASRDEILAPIRDRLAFEALAMLGVILVIGFIAYAYEKSMHLRRVSERAQSEARFSAIVNTAMDAIMVVDPSFRVAMANNAAERMFGFTARDVATLSALDLVPDDWRGEFRRLAQSALGGSSDALRASPLDRFAAGRRRDGSVFPIDLSISRTQLEGRPHLAIVIRDVTLWRRAEDSSEWQRRVLEAIATGMALRDVLGAIVRFHETQCPGTECEVHVIDDAGVALQAASAPSMRAPFVQAMDDLVVGPSATTCGAAVHQRDLVITTDISSDALWKDHGAVASVEGYRACWSHPILAPQGRLLGAFTAYVRDARPPTGEELRVTATAVQLAGIAIDRAYAAESLQQSEASFRAFVENSPIGIYRATGGGRFLAVNHSLVALLGYDSPGDLLQVDAARDLFVSASERERLAHDLDTRGELRSAETEWRRRDGSGVAVRVSARAYRDERGDLGYSEGFVENVSPLRAAERALRQSEKLAALGQLVSGVAHELNNPLASILHFAEDLLEDERSQSDHEALSIIRDQARRSRAIVRDLLSFVRFRDTSRERVYVHDLLLATLRGLEPTIQESGARLTHVLPGAGITVSMDRVGLQQIVTNLVVNAAQASGPGGLVALVASIADGELTLTVEDSGSGVPPKLLDRIFEPFFTTKPLGAGTGLGLSVTLGIVQQLDGRIHVENRPADEGGGARFTVTLPLHVIDSNAMSAVSGTSATASIVATPPAGVAVVGGPRALIIDDEPTIRAALRRFFLRRGWQVDEASDGAQALAVLVKATPAFDIVISDLKMPGCSGVELHDQIATVAPELLDRIIFSTGDVASSDAAEFVSRTRCTVLQKPFELRALERIISHTQTTAVV